MGYYDDGNGKGEEGRIRPCFRDRWVEIRDRRIRRGGRKGMRLRRQKRELEGGACNSRIHRTRGEWGEWLKKKGEGDKLHEWEKM